MFIELYESAVTFDIISVFLLLNLVKKEAFNPALSLDYGAFTLLASPLVEKVEQVVLAALHIDARRLP